MQLSCPCCSRPVNVVTPAPQGSVFVDRTFINEKLSEYDSICGLDVQDDSTYISQNLELADSYERDHGPVIGAMDSVAHCSCGAMYSITTLATLKAVRLPLRLTKSWLDEDVKESMDLYEPVAHYSQSTHGHTGFHGASVQGCVHNHVFQYRESNGVRVKCTKCGHTKLV